MPRETDPQKYIAVSSLLHDIRKDSGLRQADLARRLNVPQSFVSKYELGERRLDIVELFDLCEALEIKFTDFAARLENILQRRTV